MLFRYLRIWNAADGVLLWQQHSAVTPNSGSPVAIEVLPDGLQDRPPLVAVLANNKLQARYFSHSEGWIHLHGFSCAVDLVPDRKFYINTGCQDQSFVLLLLWVLLLYVTVCTPHAVSFMAVWACIDGKLLDNTLIRHLQHGQFSQLTGTCSCSLVLARLIAAVWHACAVGHSLCGVDMQWSTH